LNGGEKGEMTIGQINKIDGKIIGLKEGKEIKVRNKCRNFPLNFEGARQTITSLHQK
jgi:hypothetical protein